MKLSEIEPREAEFLFGKVVKVRHIKTGVELDVSVVDYCCDRQTGFIFQLTKYKGMRDLKRLRRILNDLQTLDVDRPRGKGRPIAVDGRDIFDGAKFELIL